MIRALGFMMVLGMDQVCNMADFCARMVMRYNLVGKDQQPRNEKKITLYFNTVPQKPEFLLIIQISCKNSEKKRALKTLSLLMWNLKHTSYFFVS